MYYWRQGARDTALSHVRSCIWNPAIPSIPHYTGKRAPGHRLSARLFLICVQDGFERDRIRSNGEEIRVNESIRAILAGGARFVKTVRKYALDARIPHAFQQKCVVSDQYVG